MQTYRSKIPVEAMRWTDTPENRAAFTAWFEHHGARFETRGVPEASIWSWKASELVLPDFDGIAAEGRWVVRLRDAWVVMDDALFANSYEEACP